MKTVGDLINELSKFPENAILVKYDDADIFDYVRDFAIRHMDLYKKDNKLAYWKEDGKEAVNCIDIDMKTLWD